MKLLSAKICSLFIINWIEVTLTVLAISFIDNNTKVGIKKHSHKCTDSDLVSVMV